MTVNLFLGTLTIGFLLGTLMSWGANKIYRVERIMELREAMRPGRAVEQPLSTVIQELGQLYLAQGDITLSCWEESHIAVGRRVDFYYWTD